MASCRVEGCTRTIYCTGLCRPHRSRLDTYGTAGPIDPPIPHYDAPGVSEERVAELKAMSWRELVVYCDWLRS